MPSLDVVLETDIVPTPRVKQIEGIFDIPSASKSHMEWTVDFPMPKEWNVGVIVGPSGSGKTTIANRLFPENIIRSFEWSIDKSVLDGFPVNAGIKDIVATLSSVGFSSPPSWLRPYHVLSNGEKFRVDMARAMMEHKNLFVVDEFTSVVDRTVAQIASAAISKAVKRRNQKFVAVTCHYDVLEWLEPDWVYHLETNEFYTGRYLRPRINLEIRRVKVGAWQIFQRHHYLDANIHRSSRCFGAFIDERIVAFCAVLHFPHYKSKNIKRDHRTVCLPDFQGVGIGNALNEQVASMCLGLGFRFLSQTSHPGMIAYRNNSSNWKMISRPHRASKAGATSKMKTWNYQTKRNVASFEFFGEKMNNLEARELWG